MPLSTIFHLIMWNCSDIVVRFVFHCIIYNNIFVGRHHRGSDHTDVVSSRRTFNVYTWRSINSKFVYYLFYVMYRNLTYSCFVLWPFQYNCQSDVVRFVFHCIIYNNIFVGRHHRGSDHTDVVSLNLDLDNVYNIMW
jgi:hypothetical protein